MSNRKIIPAAIFAGGCFAISIALSFLGSANAAGFQSQPVPQPIYTVTQRSADGAVIMTERAVDYTYTDGGCLKYKTPDDQARNQPKWRLICGSPVSVKPEEK